MRLQRIYSSKLYLTSSRKSQIDSEINSPFNKELVMQLEDYLDDESQAELKYAESEVKKEQASENADNDSVVSAPEGHSAPSGGHSFSGDVFKDFGGDDFGGDDIPEGDTESPDIPVDDVPATDEELAATTKVSGKSINATTVIWSTFDDVVSECDTIQGTLNSREDTKGVTRLQVKDAELWVYYNDDANLNDKMIDVIEVLNSTGYTYLKFNRLARSNNAVVFDIGLVEEPIKSEKDIQDEK